jgi:hypothetical protein
VPRPVVYRSIERLLQGGLIVAVRAEPGDHGPVRTVMRATAAGRRQVNDWLSEPVAHPRDVRSELMVKLTLRERSGRSPGVLARAQLDAFGDLFSSWASRTRRATGTDRLLARWRFENTRAIERTLRAIDAEP